MFFLSSYSIPVIEARLLATLNIFNESYKEGESQFYYKIQSKKIDQQGNLEYIVQARTKRLFIDMVTRKLYLRVEPNGSISTVDLKLGRGTSIIIFPFSIVAIIICVLIFASLYDSILGLVAIGGVITGVISAITVPILIGLLFRGCFSVRLFASDHIRSGNSFLKIINVVLSDSLIK